jgi:hypothetical protein
MLVRHHEGVKHVIRVCVCALLLAACTGGIDRGQPAVTSPVSAPRTTVTASPIPVPHGTKVDHPHSPPSAVVSVPYPFKLYTHCGIDFHVDFDGSFWQLVKGSVDGPFKNPEDVGGMTLLPSGLAEFQSLSGSSVQFVRYTYPKPFQVCA